MPKAPNRSHGRYDDVEPIYRNLLARFEEQRGPAHSDTLRVAMNLGNV